MPHAEVLRAGPHAWNTWRRENPGVVPALNDLEVSIIERQFGRVQGGPINLSRAQLCRAQLDQATLIEANLVGAVLTEADLSDARLDQADLRGATFAHATLSGARLEEANLCGADLRLAKGLTQAQIEQASGDRRTTLPAGLTAPKAWFLEVQPPALGQLMVQPSQLHKAGDDPDDPSAILGISAGASIQDVRVAWLKLVKELHPDGAPSDAPVSERLKAINGAYQKLKDLEREGNRRATAHGLFHGRIRLIVLFFLAVIALGTLFAMF